MKLWPVYTSSSSIPSPGTSKICIPVSQPQKTPQNPVLQRKTSTYTEAMQAFQDDYWEHVGGPSALARIGPGRRRLTRDEWAKEQAELRAQAATMHAGRAKLEDLQIREKRLSELARRTLAQAEHFMRRLVAHDAPHEEPEPPTN